MNRNVKFILRIFSFIVVLFIVDIIAILIFNRPLLAVKDKNAPIYRGLFYDTFNCPEFSTVQVRRKGLKMTCSTSLEKAVVTDIIDRTKLIKDFTCAELLEGFYADDTYNYSWSCMKDEYMIVVYDVGYEEKVSTALKENRITIDDLDKYNIEYIKTEK